MINARRLNALIWTINVLLITLTVTQVLSFSKSHTRDVEPFDPLPINGPSWERLDASSLKSLPNPLLPPEVQIPGEVVLLIGIDRIMNETAADTAYLFLVGRKIHVNAYVGEPIREGPGGREVSELTGWRLKSINSKGAVFSTPHGDKTLELAHGPALLATANVSPDEARTVLDIAVELFKDGRLEDAGVMFEEALRQRPTSESVYAFFKRAGEDVVAAMMNSKNRKIREIGYRIFELAKPGGERRRISNA